MENQIIQKIKNIENSPHILSFNVDEVFNEYFNILSEEYRKYNVIMKDKWYDPEELYMDDKEDAEKETWEDLLPRLKQVNKKYKELYNGDYQFKIYRVVFLDKEAKAELDKEMTRIHESDVVFLIEDIINKEGYNLLIEFYQKGIIINLFNSKKNNDISYIVEIIQNDEQN